MMELPKTLLSQFAELAKNDTKNTEGSMVFGTTVKTDSGLYVKIDGSNQLTPVTAMADVKNDERVMVLIKDHSATIMGNVSSPSARIDDVEEIRSKTLIIGANIDNLQLGTTNYLERSKTMLGYEVYDEEPLTNAAGEELTNAAGEVLTAGVLEIDDETEVGL